ncbi:cell division protein SepF [Brevibacterium samyangense]|uniref:Cell division protein SepF n=1 Tax=Brevibacterium samyangense TaxID=366888 RepID=A0ABN2TDH6_9MICO
MSAMKKLGTYLGFVEEDQDDFTPAHAERDRRTVVEEAPADSFDTYEDEEEDAAPAAVTPIRSSVRPVESAPLAAMNRIRTIHPRSYNDAKAIGTAFRDGIPVIMNLTAMDEANSKRLVDFSAGLIFGLRGSIEKVTNNVFLLTPENVEVSGEDASPARTQASFFNQS